MKNKNLFKIVNIKKIIFQFKKRNLKISFFPIKMKKKNKFITNEYLWNKSILIIFKNQKIQKFIVLKQNK